MSDAHLLAIDVGTQSVRALLVDLAGTIVARARVALEPPVAEHPGWAEQRPELFWDALCAACQELWRQPGVDRSAVAGVALTTQRGTIVNVDAAGHPLRPAMLWLDQRRTRGLTPVGGLWGAAFQVVGMRETVAYFQAEAEVNWLQAHQPEVWAKTHKLLLLSGYLTYRLVGRFVDSVGAQVAYLPFDYRRQRWAGPRDWKWLAVPMDRALLPELVPPTATLGEITASAAEATGITAGLPLIAAASDKACEALGAGSAEAGVACLSYGTAACVQVTERRYREVQPLIPPYPSAVPGGYNLEIQVYRGFWMVEWFRREFGLREEQLAAAQGSVPEALFDELVRAVPPGADGLILQPYWSPGLKVPGPEARGAVIGFTAAHTRAHLYRAILEGLAYALREGQEQLVRRTGVPIRQLRVAGGGSRSDAAMQLTADVFSLPAARPHVDEASGLGAAIDAAVGLGLYRDIPSAVAGMTRVGRVFEPDAHAGARYDELYRRVYLPLYRRLRPLYDELRAISAADG